MDKMNSIDYRKERLSEGIYFVDNSAADSVALSVLLQGSITKAFQRDQIIYLQGEEGNNFYYIRRGKVKISITNSEGYEKILAICGSQTFIAEHIMEHQAYSSTATALEESHLCAIEAERFESLAVENPAIALMMLRCVKRKLSFLAAQIADLCFLTAEGKIAHALLEMERRTRQKTSKGSAKPEKITHETLANLTGLTRSTVTTILNDLENMDILQKRRGSLLVVDKERLATIVADHLLL
jgi:CRP/FNR family transcriptional regulator, cyclic AMP receptor protein